MMIALAVYLLIGAAFCLWLQFSFGNAVHWHRYPVAILFWPFVMLFAGRDG